jgi:hypothetical protein
LLLAPVLLLFYSYQLLRERQPQRVFFAFVVSLGLALLLDQLRLHHFGYFALALGTILVLDELRRRLHWHRGLIFVGAFGLLVLAFQPALRDRLFIHYAPSADPEYASALPLFLELNTHCADDPGTVLASNDDGSAILFHSECSVIANNFVLRNEDKAHIDEVSRLMGLTPEEIRTARPDVKYVLLRVRDFSVFQDNVAYLVADSPVAKQLLIDTTPPPGFVLLKTIRRRLDEEGPAGTYAKLFKVVR